mgnify:CR=1 FL=1
MFYLFVSIFAIAGVSLWGINNKIFPDLISELFFPIVFISSCVGLVFAAMLIIPYIASQHKAELINQQYGTHYTQSDVFYAEDIIKEIQTHRLELTSKSENLSK